MDKQTALAVLGASIAVGVLCDHIDQRKRNKLESRLEEYWMKRVQRHWRDAYTEGFNECNARNNYSIPRSLYPKFD